MQKIFQLDMLAARRRESNVSTATAGTAAPQFDMEKLVDAVEKLRAMDKMEDEIKADYLARPAFERAVIRREADRIHAEQVERVPEMAIMNSLSVKMNQWEREMLLQGM